LVGYPGSQIGRAAIQLDRSNLCVGDAERFDHMFQGSMIVDLLVERSIALAWWEQVVQLTKKL
jgi:hypothetical protein